MVRLGKKTLAILKDDSKREAIVNLLAEGKVQDAIKVIHDKSSKKLSLGSQRGRAKKSVDPWSSPLGRTAIESAAGDGQEFASVQPGPSAGSPEPGARGVGSIRGSLPSVEEGSANTENAKNFINHADFDNSFSTIKIIGVGTPTGTQQKKNLLTPMQQLQKGLAKRFKNIYEAYIYFDLNGDWSVTLNELKLMIPGLGIQVSEIDSVFRELDDVKDGKVDPKEFMTKLSWHPLNLDSIHAVELAKPRRANIVKKAKRLAEAEAAITKGVNLVTAQATGKPMILSQGRGGRRKSSPQIHASLLSRPSSTENTRASLAERRVSRAYSAESGGSAGAEESAKAVSAGQGSRSPSPRGVSLDEGTIPARAPEPDFSELGPRRKLKVLKNAWSQVDFSWRKTCPKGQDKRFSDMSGASSSFEAEQVKRSKLFLLFQQFDEDKSGTLEPAEIVSLLSNMGHHYTEEEVRKALHMVNPSAVNDCINFEEFCEWWASLDWFHNMGIFEGAVTAASIRYKKAEWMETVSHIQDEMRKQKGAQQLESAEYERTARWIQRQKEVHGGGTSGSLIADAITRRQQGNEHGSFGKKQERVQPKTANDFFALLQRRVTRDREFPAGRKKSVAAFMGGTGGDMQVQQHINLIQHGQHHHTIATAFKPRRSSMVSGEGDGECLRSTRSDDQDSEADSSFSFDNKVMQAPEYVLEAFGKFATF